MGNVHLHKSYIYILLMLGTHCMYLEYHEDIGGIGTELNETLDKWGIEQCSSSWIVNIVV